MKKRIFSFMLGMALCFIMLVEMSKPIYAGVDEIVAISAGSYHTAVIKNNGSLWVWGLDDFDNVT